MSMSSKVRLSAEQKKALSVLEPQSRLCPKSGDLNKAKKVTGEIVKLLRPTGHDTRILQAKNWLRGHYKKEFRSNSASSRSYCFTGYLLYPRAKFGYGKRAYY